MTARERHGAHALIHAVLEHESFTSWDQPVPERPRAAGYEEELRLARERSEADESIVTGEGRVGRHRVAVVVSEFGFLGGSLGVDAAARVVTAVHRATREGLPLLAAPASGGTRMQEGTVAFVQMVTITAALSEHRKAGLPYLVYLRNPTTGGVFASWGSLGHVTVAEPGALVGFLGPRVYRALHGNDFPEGVQTAENLYEHGLLDAVLDASHLGKLAARVLDVWVSHGGPAPEREPGETTETDDWTIVERSRASARPGLRSVLRHTTLRPVPLSGTGRGESDRALTLTLTRFGGQGAVVLGQDRRSQGGELALGPGALRVAGRGIRLAAEIGLPLVTLIDTPGAALSREAEEGGLAGEIARCLVALLETPVPTVSVILGQGTGGGALALLPADRVLVAENGWLSPLPPEGAATIVHRDPALAPRLARAQRIGAAHLLADGVVDEVISEGDDPASAIASAITRALATVVAIPARRRLRERGIRFAGLRPHTPQ